MIISKTPQFQEKFLKDLSSIVIYKKDYEISISKWKATNDLMKIGYRNQPSRNVKFFGSYFDKKAGSYVTDIDVILLLFKLDDKFYLRMVDIMKNLHKTPFQFVRFYCGYIDGLEPPWNINDKGGCNFEIKRVDEWLSSIKVRYPNVYEKVKPYLVKETISMMDLINAEKAIEPMISLNWKKEEIIQGYKMYEGVRYDFKECMKSYPRYRVMKFMYSYQGMYCLVDLNFRALDGSLPNASSDPLRYYTNDVYKKYKYLKKMLIPEKTDEYNEDRKKVIGHITPLAAFVELIDKIRKYDIVDKRKINDMINFAKKYSINNRIDTVEYDKIQKIILRKVTPLYEKYKEYIKEEFKPEIFLFEIRALQLNEQIDKKLLEYRYVNGYDCPLFPINNDQIETLYKKSKSILIDPKIMYICIYESVTHHNINLSEFMKEFFDKISGSIKVTEEGYALFRDDTLIEQSSSIKKLQLQVILNM